MEKSNNYLSQFVNQSLTYVTAQICQALPMLAATLFIGRLNDPMALGVFGLSNTILTMAYIIFIKGIGEAMSLRVHKSLKINDDRKAAENFWKAMLLYFFVFILFSLVCVFSNYWLLAIKIEQNLAMKTSLYLIYSIPYLFLQGFNLLIQDYASCLQAENNFKIMNVLSIVICMIGAYFFIIYFDKREYGYIYTKMFQEIVILFFSIELIKFKIDKERFVFPSLRNLFRNIFAFIANSLNTLATYIGLLIGFEVNTYCASLVPDINELATWVIFVYIQSVYYFSGMGFQISVRALIQNILQQKGWQRAKQQSKFFFFYIFLYAMIFVLVIVFCRKQIVGFFTQSEKIIQLLSKCLLIYLFNIYSEQTFLSLTSLLRLLKQEKKLFLICSVFYPIYGLVTSPLYCFTFDFGVMGLVLSFSTAKFFTVVLMFWCLYSSDWSKAAEKDDSQDNMIPLVDVKEFDAKV